MARGITFAECVVQLRDEIGRVPGAERRARTIEGEIYRRPSRRDRIKARDRGAIGARRSRVAIARFRDDVAGRVEHERGRFDCGGLDANG